MKSANGHLAMSHRVLIIESHSVMGAGVEALLSSSGYLQVVGSAPQNEMDLLRQIWRLTPDVIVLSQRSQLTGPIRLLSLLKDYGSFRIIVVSEDENVLEVYEKECVVVRRPDDLTTAVGQN